MVLFNSHMKIVYVSSTIYRCLIQLIFNDFLLLIRMLDAGDYGEKNGHGLFD